MKKVICLALLTTCLSILLMSGCEPASEPMDQNDDGTTPTDTELNEQSVDNTSPTSTLTIPPGSLALFATISGERQNDFLRIEGRNVSWDTTHYKLLRYIPEAQILDEFGWTSSKSYSKTYIYGITAGDWVYKVKCFTDSGRKDITRLNPETGDIVGQFGTITTGDMYRGFTISGDKVYYRTKVTKDQLGNRRSGGDVMAMEIGTTNAVEVLDYYDDDNQGRYYGIGNELISIVTTYEDNAIFYDIYRINPEDMAIGELLYSFGSEEHITFHEGITSLFWSEVDSTTGNTDIIMFPLSEYPMYFLTISESTPKSLSIDESQGKVLVTFDDDTSEGPFYYLADIDTDEVIELDINPGFYSRSIYGNGQLYILE